MFSEHSGNRSGEPPVKRYRGMLIDSIPPTTDFSPISRNFSTDSATPPSAHSSSITNSTQDHKEGDMPDMSTEIISAEEDEYTEFKDSSQPLSSIPHYPGSENAEPYSTYLKLEDESNETTGQDREANENDTSAKDSSTNSPAKKRTRATPEQLLILEEAFMTNISPNSKVREALAERINMSERSIQIWFQNRRAKVKLMQKRSHLVQETMSRQYFNSCMPFTQGMYPFRNDITSDQGGMYTNGSTARFTTGVEMSEDHPNSYTSSGYQFDPTSIGMNPHLAPRVAISPSMPTQNGVAKLAMVRGMSAPVMPVVNPTTGVHPFTCDTLSIGTWRRMAITKNDLLCYFNLTDKKMSWHITDNNSRFKMEFDFLAIVGIEFKILDAVFGQIAININQVPEFSMEVKVGNNSVWTTCRDFTEGKQASSFFRHVIRGHAQPLKRQIITLMQADMSLQKTVRIEPLSNMTRVMAPQRRQSFPDKSIAHSFNTSCADLLAARRNSVDEHTTRRATSVPMQNIMSLHRFSRESSLCADTFDSTRYNSLMVIDEIGNVSPMNDFSRHDFTSNENIRGNGTAPPNFVASGAMPPHPVMAASPLDIEASSAENLTLTSPLDLYRNHQYEQLQMISSGMGISDCVSSSWEDAFAMNSMYLLGSSINSPGVDELNNSILGHVPSAECPNEHLPSESYDKNFS
ncbi:hypothetical protein K7432_008530 [Basidiobolus ranarum]|uniref:Homeobox domain-containing protein n=1 Tax=Basidiobolus ranarum TaxID=34480 RepID=A0ABR2VZB7_9FUNG